MRTGEEDTINIRPMTRDDIHAVLALDKKLGNGRGLLSDKDMAATNPGGPLDLSFVAEVEGHLIGFIMSRLAYLMIPLNEVCIIQGMLIDPAYQRRGTGRRLLQTLLDYCQSEEISIIRALIPERNEELRHFFDAYGFHRSTIINYDKTFES